MQVPEVGGGEPGEPDPGGVATGGRIPAPSEGIASLPHSLLKPNLNNAVHQGGQVGSDDKR